MKTRQAGGGLRRKPDTRRTPNLQVLFAEEANLYEGCRSDLRLRTTQRKFTPESIGSIFSTLRTQQNFAAN